jgi:hypothetical protein
MRAGPPPALGDIVCFNEAIDHALTEPVSSFSSQGRPVTQPPPRSFPEELSDSQCMSSERELWLDQFSYQGFGRSAVTSSEETTARRKRWISRIENKRLETGLFFRDKGQELDT